MNKLKRYFGTSLFRLGLLILIASRSLLQAVPSQTEVTDHSLVKGPPLFQAVVANLNKSESTCIISKNQVAEIVFLFKNDKTVPVPPEENKRLLKIFQRKISHKFSRESLEKTIRNLFDGQGYWHCQVHSTFNPKGKLLVEICKGPRFTIKKISVKTNVMKKTINQIFNIGKTSEKNITPYSLENSRKNVLLLLRKSGFWNAQVLLEPKPEIQTDEQVTLVIKIIVKTGQRAKFGPINVRGNNTINTELIKKQIPFKPGDFWDSNLLYKAKNNLESLAVFDNVQLLCGHVPQAPEAFYDTTSIPVTVELTESFPRELKFGFGFSSKSKISELLNFPQHLGFKAGISFAKKNLILPYDEGRIICDFNLDKGSVRSEYNYGKLKNFPLEIKTSLFAEKQIPKTNSSQKLEHKICSINCNVIKRTPTGSSAGVALGFLTTNIQTHKTELPYEFCYTTASSHICSENLQGNWLNETGVVLSASNKIMYSLNKKHQSIGRLQFFGTFFTPINATHSLANKAGVVIAYSWGKTPTKLSYLNDLKNTEYLIGPDPLLMNGICNPAYKNDFFEHDSIRDILKKNEKAIYATIELRRLLNNYAGVAVFCNLKITQNQKPQFLTGIGARFGANLSGLLLDVGWDSNAKNIFWRFSMGAF